MSQRFFEDAQHATLYAKFRPIAPAKLEERIVTFLKEKYQDELELCLDVGCGNGQCSALFATSFRKVLATDISPAQVEMAETMNHPSNVEFMASPAEKSPAGNESVQLVVACTAAHWFDLPAFFNETDRILCRNGIVALTSYFLPIVVCHPQSDDLNQALADVFFTSFGSFWGDGVRHLENEYGDISIPYEETVREFVWTDEEPCTLADLVNDIKTWSGYHNLCRAKGESAGQEICRAFLSRCQQCLNTTDEPGTVHLITKRKFFLLMGRKV